MEVASIGAQNFTRHPVEKVQKIPNQFTIKKKKIKKALRSNYVKLDNLRVAKATELSHSYVFLPWYPVKKSQSKQLRSPFTVQQNKILY